MVLAQMGQQELLLELLGAAEALAAQMEVFFRWVAHTVEVQGVTILVRPVVVVEVEPLLTATALQ